MNLEQLITKRIDLIKNDGLSSFNGMAAQQTHEVFEVFSNFLKEIKPKRILEIGTALGGFTQFLDLISKENNLDIDIRTYDIHEMNWYKDLRLLGIDVRIENVFADDYKSVKQEVVDFIRKEGTTLVLCDGGNKVGEFIILSNYIKKGDFILAHDYAENRKIFEEKINRKIWNWFEISNEDIYGAVSKNNLEYYNKDIFEGVVWTCRQKK